VSCVDGEGWCSSHTTQLDGGAVQSRSAAPVGSSTTTAGSRRQQQTTMGRRARCSHQASVLHLVYGMVFLRC
jgi:hypothetical protein